MKHPFRWIAIGAGVVIVVLAAVLAANVDTDPRAEANTSRLLGKPAPAVSLTRLDGTKVTSADLADKTVIVNFWNSWCIPCQDELPTLRRWYAAHANDPNVVMLGIPRDEPDKSATRAAAKDDGIAWTVANDGGAEQATLDFATRGQPETFAISPSGVIVGSVIGPITTAQLDRMLEYSSGAQ